MTRNWKSAASIILLALVILFVTTSCQKLNMNYLRGNYYFNRANHQFTEGLYRLAIEEYERALSYNPELTDAYRFLGESYKQLFKPGVEDETNMERAQKALEALQKAYEINPNSKDVIYSLGDMYDKLRNFKEAEKLYLRIIEMDPTNMGNYYVAAEFYKRYAGDQSDDEKTEGEEGEEEGEKLLAVGGKTPFEKAEEMYLRRIETDPENDQGYSYIAQFYENMQPRPDFDKAYGYHLMRTQLDPESAEAWLSVGVNRWSKTYRLQNELSRRERLDIAKDSEEALNKAKDLDPSYPVPYSWLSVLYRSVLAKIDPDRARRYEELADRYLERFQEARKREAEKKKMEEELGEIR
jgi:tetratricopeptide (TPR) repeat protein